MNKLNKLNNKDYVNPDIRMSLEDDDDDKFSSGSSKKNEGKSTTPVLDTYSRDLTKMAEDGKLEQIAQ